MIYSEYSFKGAPRVIPPLLIKYMQGSIVLILSLNYKSYPVTSWQVQALQLYDNPCIKADHQLFLLRACDELTRALTFSLIVLRLF